MVDIGRLAERRPYCSDASRLTEGIVVFRPYFLNANFVSEASDVQSYPAYDISSRGNIGNIYITHAVIRALFGKLTQIEGVRNLWSLGDSAEHADRINSEFSHAILILQDHARESFKTLDFSAATTLIERLKIPLVVFSLGANSLKGFEKDLHLQLSAGQIRFLKALANKSESLGIRGTYTAEVLESLGIRNTTIVGCPTYFETGPGRKLQKRELDPDFKVMATGAFSNPDSRRLTYFLQDEALLMKLLYFSDAISNEERDLLFMRHPGYADCIIRAVNDGRVEFHTSIDEWKRSAANGFAFCVGTRVHGAIMAMNTGIPALLTNGDARAREMSEFFGITRRLDVGYPTPLQDIYDSIDITAANARYEGLYRNYAAWLRANGLSLKQTGLADEITMPDVQKKDIAEVRKGLVETLTHCFTLSVASNDQNIAALAAQIRQFEAQSAEIRNSLKTKTSQAEELRTELNAKEAAIQRSTAEISNLHQTLSWRATAPLRWTGGRFPRIKNWIKSRLTGKTL